MRLIVALVLLFAVTPGMTEVAEGVAHAIGHGDLPHHDEGDESEGGPCDEHTCTPLFHACGCHAPMSAQPGLAASKPDVFSRIGVVSSFAPRSVSSRVSEPPPLRPPIA